MAEKDDGRLRAYIVIARSGTADKKYQDCRVIPHGDPFPATHNQVFGPASQKDCEKWMAANCGGKATA